VAQTKLAKDEKDARLCSMAAIRACHSRSTLRFRRQPLGLAFGGGFHTRTTNKPMKVMKRKIETSSLLLGAFAGAVAVLCVAAATTKTNAGAALQQRESGDTTAKGEGWNR
jgi:hypothetical protein